MISNRPGVESGIELKAVISTTNSSLNQPVHYHHASTSREAKPNGLYEGYEAAVEDDLPGSRYGLC